MSNKVYGAIDYDGGTAGAMDALDGDLLSDGDMCIVIHDVANQCLMYTLNSTSGVTESAPAIISPDSNAGTKRWILSDVYGYDGSNTHLLSDKPDRASNPINGNLIKHDANGDLYDSAVVATDVADAVTKKHDEAHTIASHSDTTATGTELNILDGATLTTAELNYVDGVTSPIQTQLNAKVNNTGNENIAGIKTFSSFPVTPSSAPSSNYQVANKKYVDDNLGQGSVKAWVNFNGATGSIRDSFNVTSVSRTATGRYIITWDTNFSNTYYCFTGMGGSDSGSGSATCLVCLDNTQATPVTTGALYIQTLEVNNEASRQDFEYICVSAIGDQ